MRRHTLVVAVLNLTVGLLSARAQEAPDAPPAPPKDTIREAYEAHAPTPALPYPEPEDLKPIPDPEPLVFMDGRKVQTKEDWEARKKEILDLVQHYIFGFCGPEELLKGTPPPEVVKEEKDAYGGLATMYEIKVALCPDPTDAQDVMWLALAVPNTGKGPFPTVLHFKRPSPAHASTTSKNEVDQCSEYAIKRGYAVAGFTPQQGMSMYRYYFPIHSGPWVDGTDKRFAHRPAGTPGVNRLDSRRPLHGCGEPAVWAWRMRRMMDALVVQKEVDAKRVIFVGGSRFGMAVVLAGALDQRAAMVYAWQPAAGLRNRGHLWTDRPEWAAIINQAFYERLDRIPVDTYCAAATLAPRPLLVTGTFTGYTPMSADLYEKIASAYRFMGAEVQRGELPTPGKSVIYTKGPLGLHVRDGGHEWRLDDFKAMLDFADEYLKPKPSGPEQPEGQR